MPEVVRSTFSAEPLSVTTMSTVSLWPAAATFLRSNVTSGSPRCTMEPLRTCAVKPSPFISTVSSPMWMSSSRPEASVSPTAWPVSSIMTVTEASHGATTSPADGSMATPSPMVPDAKTASSTWDSGMTVPETAAQSVPSSASSPMASALVTAATAAPTEDSGVPVVAAATLEPSSVTSSTPTPRSIPLDLPTM